MAETMNIIAAETINIFFELKYFWITPTGGSTRKDTKLPIPRNIPTAMGLFKTSKKKNTSVK
jgi:hypothetical protein